MGCHGPVLEAIGHKFMQQAQAGKNEILLDVKIYLSLHTNEMAYKLANEAADECCMGRHF